MYMRARTHKQGCTLGCWGSHCGVLLVCNRSQLYAEEEHQEHCQKVLAEGASRCISSPPVKGEAGKKVLFLLLKIRDNENLTSKQIK